MELLSRLCDANIFLLEKPAVGGFLIVGTLHPFNLDGRGYEVRIYKINPKRFEVSPEASAPGGWGVDEVVCREDSSLELTRDEDYSLRIWLNLPASVSIKRVFLERHPDLQDGRPPSELLELLNSSESRWEQLEIRSCEDVRQAM